MFKSLVNPNFPSAAIGLKRESVSVVSLQKQGRAFGLRRAATVELPENVLQPSFNEQNIEDPDEVLAALREAVTMAGLQGQKKWSVSLPADAARMSVLTLEVAPKSKKELSDVLNWKAERAFGAKPEEMRLTFQLLAADADKHARYFAVAIKLDVLAEYEDLFDALGWRVGLILPRYLSEAQWLMSGTGKKQGDGLLVSSQRDVFTAVLFRQAQPVVVRSVTCEIDERDDELYRFLLFYRDRWASENIGAEFVLEHVLPVGEGFDKERLSEISQETLGYDLRVLDPQDVGLVLPPEIRFEDVAAPAALASLSLR